MASNRDETYEKLLAANLTRVLDLLKFAEAKNAALLAFASGWIVGLVNLLSSGKELPAGYPMACMIALPAFVGAGVLALISLLPKLRTSVFTGEPHGASKNLLFFGHVAKLDVAEFQTAVRAAYEPAADGSIAPAYLADLEAQIAINSKIATRKYRFLSAGGWLALVAVAVLAYPTARAVLIYAAHWICQTWR